MSRRSDRLLVGHRSGGAATVSTDLTSAAAVGQRRLQGHETTRTDTFFFFSPHPAYVAVAVIAFAAASAAAATTELVATVAPQTVVQYRGVVPLRASGTSW